MKQMKITIEMVEPKDVVQTVKDAKNPKKIGSVKDLRSLLEEQSEEMSYGETQFGAVAGEDDSDETEDRIEGAGQKATPDDKALDEDNETRIKNSKHPTIVGKKMK